MSLWDGEDRFSLLLLQDGEYYFKDYSCHFYGQNSPRYGFAPSLSGRNFSIPQCIRSLNQNFAVKGYTYEGYLTVVWSLVTHRSRMHGSCAGWQEWLKSAASLSILCQGTFMSQSRGFPSLESHSWRGRQSKTHCYNLHFPEEKMRARDYLRTTLAHGFL